MAESNQNGASTRPAPPYALNHAQTHLRQKRARSQLSCTPCRTGKLKCNREKDPACDQCIKRNRELACAYAPPPVKSKPPQNVKGRIRQLENLVVNLMEQQSKEQQKGRSTGQANGTSSEEDGSTSSQAQTSVPYSEPTPPSDVDASPLVSAIHRGDSAPESGVDRPFGQMKISKDEISYHGESHWKSILDSISDLKRELGEGEEAEEGAQVDENEEHSVAWQNVHFPSKPDPPHAPAGFGLGFMLGTPSLVTREDLISSLPDKRTMDRLLSLWFNSPDPFKPIIHAPTFQLEYKRFARDPTSTPTMWIGLLYTILSLAESFGLRSAAPDPECLVRVSKYHGLAASAAILADFTKPKQHTLECLILYASGLRSSNAFVNVWLTLGLVVRLALRMGYHRDPSHYASTITPFAGEMRRRVWATISMIDVLVSFQLGLPSMVRTIATDTQPPSNLLDRDFNDASTSLPPPRSIDELTPSSYVRAKVRLVRIFAQAAELSHATTTPSRQEIDELDAALEVAHEAVPPLLRFPQGVTEPAEQLMCATNLDLLYLKTKTVLHRRYMHAPLSSLSSTEQELGVGTSRRICIDCGLRVLRHHQSVQAATQSGGQLEPCKWYLGSISTHDFLLAAMVLCLELSMQINEEKTQELSRGLECPRRMDIINTIERSMEIWSEQPEGEGAAETRRAGKAMGAMLQRVRRAFEQNARISTGTWAELVEDRGEGSDTELGGDFTPANDTVQTWAHPLATPPAQTATTPHLDLLSSMLAEPTAMDWTLWDSTTLQQEQPTQSWDSVDGMMWDDGFERPAFWGAESGNSAGEPDGTAFIRGPGSGMMPGNSITGTGGSLWNGVDDFGDGVGNNGTNGPTVVGGDGLQPPYRWQDLQDVDLGTSGVWCIKPSWETQRANG